MNRSFVEGAEDLIEKAESALSPDDESAEVTTGCKLEKVQPANIDDLNTRKIPERLDDAVVFIINDERATALAVPATSNLSFAGTVFPGVGDLGNIGEGINGLKESDSFLSLGQRFGTGRNNERYLLGSLYSVTTSKDKGRKSGSSQGGDDGKSTLSLINLDVPLAPGFRWGEHATAAAHITKSSLIEW